MKDERDDIARLVADLTDVAPSPEFRAKVIRRLDEGRAPGALRWRVAFAGLAVIAVASAVWFGWVREQSFVVPQDNRSAAAAPPDRHERSVRPPVNSPSVRPEAVERRTESLHRERRAERATAPRVAPSRLAAVSRPAPEPTASEVAAIEQSATEPAAIAEIVLAPLPAPQPVDVPGMALEPLVVERDDIPPLELGPLVPPEIAGPERR